MSFSQRLNELYEEIRIVIIKTVNDKGINSDNSLTSVIKITDNDLKFNLDNGRYLTEIGSDAIFDNKGYSYMYSVLDYDDLCLLADYVTNL